MEGESNRKEKYTQKVELPLSVFEGWKYKNLDFVTITN